MSLEDLLEQRIRHHIGLIAAYAGTLDVPGAAEAFEQDPMFSIFGLYGPRYLTARFGGGLITSIHRKIGDLFEDCVRDVMIDRLGLPEERATYSAEVRVRLDDGYPHRGLLHRHQGHCRLNDSRPHHRTRRGHARCPPGYP